MVVKYGAGIIVTFDGYEGEHLACPRINVWKDYKDRWGKGLVTTVDHGDTGLLLERDGEACKVQVGDDVGWLTYYFLKEFKEQWQTEQLNRQ